MFQFDCHQMIYTHYLQLYWCRIRISGYFTKKLNENFLTIKRWLLNFLHHNYKNYIIFHLHNTISLLFCNFILTSNFQYSQTRVLLFIFFFSFIFLLWVAWEFCFWCKQYLASSMIRNVYKVCNANEHVVDKSNIL